MQKHEDGLFYYFNGEAHKCQTGFVYKPNEDNTIDIFSNNHPQIQSIINKDTVNFKAEVQGTKLEETVDITGLEEDQKNEVKAKVAMFRIMNAMNPIFEILSDAAEKFVKSINEAFNTPEMLEAFKKAEKELSEREDQD